MFQSIYSPNQHKDFGQKNDNKTVHFLQESFIENLNKYATLVNYMYVYKYK